MKKKKLYNKGDIGREPVCKITNIYKTAEKWNSKNMVSITSKELLDFIKKRNNENRK